MTKNKYVTFLTYSKYASEMKALNESASFLAKITEALTSLSNTNTLSDWIKEYSLSEMRNECSTLETLMFLKYLDANKSSRSHQERLLEAAKNNMSTIKLLLTEITEIAALMAAEGEAPK